MKKAAFGGLFLAVLGLGLALLGLASAIGALGGLFRDPAGPIRTVGRLSPMTTSFP